ncbi:MAG: Gfo/Idh/MocA family oxidoreductase [Planctomycetaceae bacterium]|nr:Gfo/Idh/MocA family oxidoreductase [Planctomycetaceae bacterium]
MSLVKVVLLGAGSRGNVYSNYIQQHSGDVELVGLAEPREYYRNQFAQKHKIPKENVFEDWQGLASKDKFADAVIIALQDSIHVEPAVAFAKKGYHILLEKPMATTEQGCRQIVDAVKKANIIFGVCHVLRYTPYSQKLKNILDSGRIGEIVSIQHLEPVGYWHQAHSFVRGNWRNESQSTFMLMAKSCHDLDWIRFMSGSKCVKVSSFGNLKYFTKANKPKGASDRCLDCIHEPNCPYSAKKIYMSFANKGHFCWPVDTITNDLTVEGVLNAIKTGPYGRCVYSCDNDVVDHQVVNMLFEDGKTATFTMTAFTELTNRRTRIFGTKGAIDGDGTKIKIYDFLTDKKEEIDTTPADSSIYVGHGGGDEGLMNNFISALAGNDRSKILTGPDETLESHLMVFAAERSRRNGNIVSVEN